MSTIQKLGDDLIIIIPTDICQKLDIKEGTEIDIEPFLCGGETGMRIKPKS